MHWAVTVVNPAMSVIGVLATPQLCTAALLATLRAEVTRRSRKGPGTMTVTVCLPCHRGDQHRRDGVGGHRGLVVPAMRPSRLCDRHGYATTRPTAHFDGVEHLTAEHYATIGIAP